MYLPLGTSIQSLKDRYMSVIITIIKIIIILGFLILIHEAGHFFVARLCKIKVNEFSIGFGPVIWKKETKKTKYALRLIPLGGFVSMLGEEERSSEEGSFSEASIPKRIAVVAAGGLVNIIFAIILYIVLATIVTGNLGTAVSSTGSFIMSMVESVKLIFTGGVTVNDLMGPIGISEVVAQTSSIIDFLYIMALISMSLGVTNLLPFPPLDGGKVLIYIIEAIRRKPLKEDFELKLQMAGFLLLMTLSIYVAFNDVGRIIS